MFSEGRMDRTLAATLAGLMLIFTSPRVSFAQSDEKGHVPHSPPGSRPRQRQLSDS